jgi:cell division cycle 2-like protein
VLAAPPTRAAGAAAAARSRLPALLREAVDTAASAIQRERLGADEAAARAAADASAVAPVRRRFVDDDVGGGDAPSTSRSGRSPSHPPPVEQGRQLQPQQPAPPLQLQLQPAASPSSAFSGDAFSATPTAAAAAATAASVAHAAAASAAAAAAAVSTAASSPAAAASSSSSSWNSFLGGCRSVSAYRPLGKIDEGTYGEVFAAVDVETGAPYALKKVKMAAVSANEGFPITALRESHLLLALGGAGPRPHPNIVAVREMVVGSSLDKVYMVMELLEHDLKAVFAAMAGCFTQAEVKCLLRQLLEGVAALHAAWVCHRDLKPSNLLCDNAGRLAICDFGMARHFGAPPKAYTQPVVTLWYRAPELLLGQRVYDGAAVDMFSVGCIFAELLTRRPLFRTQGGSDAEMLGLVFALLGTPTEASWPGWSSLPGASGLRLKPRPPQSLRSALGMVGGGGGFGGTTSISDAGLELLRGLLALDPTQRITAPEALAHRWFAESPPACDPALMPSFPSSSELKVAKQRARGSARSPQPHAAGT